MPDQSPTNGNGFPAAALRALAPGASAGLPGPRRPGTNSLAAPAEGPLDLQRYLSAVMRYRWLIVACTVFGTMAGFAAKRYVVPRYTAQATIWIQSSEPRGGPAGQPIGSNQLLAASSWIDLLKSFVVLDEVVRERRLYLDNKTEDDAAFAAFTLADSFTAGRYKLKVDKAGAMYRLEDMSGTQLEQGAVGSPIGRHLGFVWTPAPADLPPGAEMPFAVAPLRDAAKGLADGLRVTIDPSGNFLRISLTALTPAGAAGIVNAVAQRYVTVATDLKRVKLTEIARLLGEQLAAAETNMHQAEAALADFRIRNITLPSEPVPAAGAVAAPRSPYNDFFSLRVEQDQLRRDQDALRLALSQMRDSVNVLDGLSSIGAVQRSPDLTAALHELTTKRAERRALEYRYTPEHPTMKRVNGDIDELEHQTIPALTRELLAQLTTRQRLLTTEVTSGGRELASIPQRSIDEARLRRDLQIAENLFASVQQRYNEARLAEASSIADVRLLDAAVPPQIVPRTGTKRLLVLGFIGGLGFGLFGAVLIDRFDPRVRYPDQVTSEGLRILGALPHVKNRKAGPDDEQVLQVVETMRGVRFSLMHAYGSAGPMLLTVSSPSVGDGKSFVSTNLALACAQAGQQTLLIDGDTRRGSLHRVFGAPRTPGLTDILSGHVTLEAATQVLKHPGLHFIGAGRRRSESPELLGSPAMVELLARVRPHYHVIIVDSPPLGAGVDPYTLGALTGNMLLVIRTGATNLAFTRSRLGMLEHLPIRLLGVVLNGVQRQELYGYYAYSYFAGYGAGDEGAAPTTSSEVARKRMTTRVGAGHDNR